MKIQLSDEQYEQLTLVVQAAGYQDVTAFIRALADQPTVDPRGTLSDPQLQDSVECLKQADASLDAGLGIDLDEAFNSLAKKHGFSLPQ